MTVKELETLSELVTTYDEKIGHRIRDNYNYLRWRLHFHELTTVCFPLIPKTPFCFQASKQLELDFS